MDGLGLVLCESEAFQVVNLHAKDGPCQIAYVGKDVEKSPAFSYYALICYKKQNVRSKDAYFEICV